MKEGYNMSNINLKEDYFTTLTFDKKDKKNTKVHKKHI